VIMLTAHSESKDIDKAAGYSIIEYVTKPFDPIELREKIDKALTHSHSIDTKNWYYRNEESFTAVLWEQKQSCQGNNL